MSDIDSGQVNAHPLVELDANRECCPYPYCTKSFATALRSKPANSRPWKRAHSSRRAQCITRKQVSLPVVVFTELTKRSTDSKRRAACFTCWIQIMHRDEGNAHLRLKPNVNREGCCYPSALQRMLLLPFVDRNLRISVKRRGTAQSSKAERNDAWNNV